MNTIKELEKKAIEIRKDLLTVIYEGGAGHTGSDLSCTDILVALYYYKLIVDPVNPEDENRDRYIQSKGHAAEVLWTVLADKGFFPKEELKTFSKFGSRILGHPNNLVPGVEMNTGSLGHGLAISVGSALAAKLDNKKYQTYTLLGDGELAEGSVWEAAMAASHYKLDNLTAIIDRNGLQITGATNDVMNIEPLAEKWEAFGWEVIEVDDGNDIAELVLALDKPHTLGKPKMIIAHTLKGKGVAEAEGVASWHHHALNDEEYTRAINGLNKEMEAYRDEK